MRNDSERALRALLTWPNTFDTAETLRCKLRLGRERGMETAFLMYPEVSDLLPELLNA